MSSASFAPFQKDWIVRHGSRTVAIPLSKASKAIHELMHLLGSDWVESKVRKYRAWRQMHSLDAPDFLFHREPDCNPLVPYFAIYEEWVSQGYPFGWTGPKAQAIRDLASLAGSVFQFEAYWRAIPGGQGENHVANMLRKHTHYRGMLTELLIATHYIQAGATKVIPRFMDPRPSSDKSDIVLTWRGQDVEVHCKSKVPGAGYLVPSDVFDFWAGCFLGDAEYFDRSWRVRLELASEVSLGKAKKLRRRFQQWLASGIVLEGSSIDDGIIASSQQIEIPPQGLSKEKVDRLGQRPRYRAFSAWEGASDGNYHAVAVFDVVSTKAPHPARALRRSLEEAKKQATGSRPAIAWIHIFDALDLDFLATSPKASNFQAWLLKQLDDANGQKISALVVSCEPKPRPLSGIAEVKDYPAFCLCNPQARMELPKDFVPVLT